MAEGSQILVSTSLKITESYISSCDVMWKGIKTNVSTALEVSENTAIELAEFAVLLAHETKFTCRNSEFINNYIGIATGNPFADNTTFVTINQSLEITGCRFYTSSNVPNPYAGQFYYTAWPTTPYGVPFNQGFAGIYLSKTGSFHIGKVGALATDRNKFYQLRNGIVARNSYSRVFGSDFYNFEGSVPKVLVDPLLDLNQFGIHNFGGSGYTNIEDNTFTNIKRGIFTEHSFARIHNNAFDIPTSDFLSGANRGIVSVWPHAHTITSNVIHNGYRGIEIIFGGTDFLSISDNKLIRGVQQNRNTGIELNSCRFSNSTIGTISLNDITINDESSSLGVSLISTTNVEIVENNIEYETETAVGNENVGISVIGGGQNQTNWNVVQATNLYEVDLDNCGILDRSFINSFFCNSIDHFSSLLRVSGTGMFTNIFTNFFFDGTIGFELVAPAMTGAHFHRENKWLGTYTNNGAFNSGPINQVTNTALTSRFTVNSSTTGNLPPNIGPIQAVLANWFFPALGYGMECEDPIPIIGYDEDTLVSMIHNDFEFEEHSSHMEWQVKANIFEIILYNPSLLSNHELDSFFSVEENEVLGILVQAQNGLFSRYGVDQIMKDATVERIISLSDDMVYIDSILTAGGASSWFNLRILKADSLAFEQDVWMELLEGEIEASMEAYEDIHNDLTSISPTSDLEDYFRTSLLLYAQFILGEGISSGDSSDIVDLINLCPMEGGRAIGVAMGLYSIIADSNLVAFITECPSPSPFAIWVPSPSFTDFDNLSAFPNPTTGDLWIRSKEQMLGLDIYRSDYRKIFTTNPASNQAYVDLGHFTNGIYIVTIYTNAGIHSQIITLLN